MSKLLVVILLLLAIPQLGIADCKSDCEKVISAADAAIKARDEQIQVQKNAIDHLSDDLRNTHADLDSANLALSAWYHNPYLLTTIGVLVGGLSVGYLLKK